MTTLHFFELSAEENVSLTLVAIEEMNITVIQYTSNDLVHCSDSSPTTNQKQCIELLYFLIELWVHYEILSP